MSPLAPTGIKDDLAQEWYRCQHSPTYFINEYCWIYSAETQTWVPFKLWPMQVKLVQKIQQEKRVVSVKTRQGGFTWIGKAYFLHAMIFDPIVNGVIFSRTLELAKEQVSEDQGLKGMYMRLPEWMKPDGGITKDNAQEFSIANGSRIRALPHTQGEGGTYTHCLFDEIDRCLNPGDDTRLYNNVRPALEKAKIVIMGSISEKTRRNSLLKNTFRAAVEGRSEYKAFFIPWDSRPDRDQAWYDNELKEAIARHDDVAEGMDYMAQQYPRTPEEAMAPASKNKRIPYHHIERVWEPMQPIDDIDAPPFAGLKIYRKPEPGHRYVMGADPAEGVPGGDDSSAGVMDADTGEEVATLDGKFEPTKVFPSMLFQLAQYYNDAAILPERNNHGWAVIGELTELIATVEGCQVDVLEMPIDGKPGWLSSVRGKVMLYDECAKQIKEKHVTIHDDGTAEQLADIGINSLRAEDGAHDDKADRFALACVARNIPTKVLQGQLFF